MSRSGELQRAAGELVGVAAPLGAGWSGAAPDRAAAHCAWRVWEVEDLATAVHAAGQALLRAG